MPSLHCYYHTFHYTTPVREVHKHRVGTDPLSLTNPPPPAPTHSFRKQLSKRCWANSIKTIKSFSESVPKTSCFPVTLVYIRTRMEDLDIRLTDGAQSFAWKWFVPETSSRFLPCCPAHCMGITGSPTAPPAPHWLTVRLCYAEKIKCTLLGCIEMLSVIFSAFWVFVDCRMLCTF